MRQSRRSFVPQKVYFPSDSPQPSAPPLQEKYPPVTPLPPGHPDPQYPTAPTETQPSPTVNSGNAVFVVYPGGIRRRKFLEWIFVGIGGLSLIVCLSALGSSEWFISDSAIFGLFSVTYQTESGQIERKYSESLDMCRANWCDSVGIIEGAGVAMVALGGVSVVLSLSAAVLTGLAAVKAGSRHRKAIKYLMFAGFGLWAVGFVCVTVAFVLMNRKDQTLVTGVGLRTAYAGFVLLLVGLVVGLFVQRKMRQEEWGRMQSETVQYRMNV